ncbi:SMC-Scp complex subunit ScpB [Parasporobacterium paucivorans]|uniref:Segregation and condensation protein B n=1 Tax=Parasporobacterium paucivorans DSM 15970 TaxID=1122934 RepID=A0A1M6F749_9FIRM|nr:SMC-Scp complex subunit ScpB [Parasporobacterium paucivorans]SHI93538.1 segregation and condensation protein B [Parasporobacterium paucivorans DSM 15970]
MEIQRLEAVIEAILFTMGGSVELKQIAAAIEHDEGTTRKIINNLMDKYDSEDRGIRIMEIDTSFQMCTKNEYYPYLINLVSSRKNHTMTNVMLETLSIIAYKQPVTRLDIEKIRGVKSDHAINKLIEYDLVRETGRLDAPGKPILFGTTEEFLRQFGIRSVDDLPSIHQDKEEDIKQEFQKELQLKLDT